MITKRIASLVAGLLPLLPIAAHAHSQGLMFIGKDQQDPSHGNLKIEYHFDRHVAGLHYSGFGTLFETDELGFGAAEDDPPHIFELDLNTDVALEVIHLDPGVQIQLNSNTITAPGTHLIGNHDQPGQHSGLHNHPHFQLVLGSDSEFGEGLVVFRIVQGTNGPGYGSSPTYVVRVTNGYLEAPDYGTGPAIDKASVKCQKKVGAVGQKYFTKVHNEIRKCFDKIADWKARQAAGHPSATNAQAQAEKACADASGSGPDSKTLLGKLAAFEAKAVSEAQMKCGTPNGTTMDGRSIPPDASNDFSQRELRTHLGMVRCRAEEVLGAAYAHVLHHLDTFAARPSQGGNPLPEYFPCLKARAHAE